MKRATTATSLALLLLGCTPKEIVVTKEVKVPVRCQVEMPFNPLAGATYNGIKFENNTPTPPYLNFIKRKLEASHRYTTELELKLQYCIGLTEQE